jgi:hypothetical protein
MHATTQSKCIDLKILEIQDWKINIQIEIKMFSFTETKKSEAHKCLQTTLRNSACQFIKSTYAR